MTKTEKLKAEFESYLETWSDFIVSVEEEEENRWSVEIERKDSLPWHDTLLIKWGSVCQVGFDDKFDIVDKMRPCFMIDMDGSEWELTELNYWRCSRFECTRGN